MAGVFIAVPLFTMQAAIAGIFGVGVQGIFPGFLGKKVISRQRKLPHHNIDKYFFLQ
jgi:hypothetical protein